MNGKSPFPRRVLQEYCLRLSEQIDQTQPFSIVGLSFGGIIATEFSKFLSPRKIVIISSVSTYHEFPVIYKLAGLLKLNKVIPVTAFTKLDTFFFWAFGVKSPLEKRMLSAISTETSPVFFQWAIDQALMWRNKVRPINLVHIHGASDKILHFNRVQADFKIEQGGHFMIFNQAGEISKLLIEHLV